MLVIQQNCGKRYKYTISALEIALSLDALMIYIEELLIKNQNMSHSGFNLYQPMSGENRKDIWVLTAVRKKIANKMIFDN